MRGSNVGQATEARSITAALIDTLGPPSRPPRGSLTPASAISGTGDTDPSSRSEPFPSGPPTDQAACVEPPLGG